MVSTPSGSVVPVPADFVPSVAENGAGIVYQEPGALGDANMVRIMDRTAASPNGYLVYYNEFGQTLDALGSAGNPLGRAATHSWLENFGS
ncbi:MAG TPA: hypothetical protein VED59_01790 [Acidimicrobiales bacterium]|nr:hypothetical protein [Acidimicrobiales bacterium]